MAQKNDRLSLPALLLLLALALGLGSYYRFLALDARPMHTDEAILATKFADFWTGKGFDYDPKDYHGPALHQVSWVYAKLAGWGLPETWTEAGLRHIPAVCGLGVMLCALLFLPLFGSRATLLAMVLTAVSPMMVYYSRYYIMEMLFTLFVALSLASWWRFSASGNRLWLILCGAFIGLQHATKETFILNLVTGFIAWGLATLLIEDREAKRLRSSSFGPATNPWKPWQILFVSAVIVSVASYSGFFRDWVSVKESITTYGNYLQRAEGSGHEKPWHYYLSLIFWRKDGLIWTEALIGGLGFVGMLHAFLGNHKNEKKQRFLIFLSLYTFGLFTAYSILAYKTPWSILTAQHALTLLAGVGAAALWGLFSKGLPNLFYQVALGLGIYHLCDESMLAIGPYKADPRNPYVYAHTTTNLLSLVSTVRELAVLKPESPPTIQVINRDQGWPLPWYFRTLPNVGYHATPPVALQGDIIIAEAEQAETILRQIEASDFDFDYKDTGLHGLRPGVPLIMLVKEDLWAHLMAQRQGLPPPAPKPPTPELPPAPLFGPPFPTPSTEHGPPAPDTTPTQN
jgi:uncharacterized protein (TIGR03663 family)